MRESYKKGLGFGITSGVITTLGMIVGLNSSTHSTLVVASGIILISIADALSDALGIHISEESSKRNSEKEVWEATIATFLAKFFFAATFIIPFLVFDLSTGIVVSILYGLILIAGFSYYIAITRKLQPCKVVFEHVCIAIIVIVVTHYIGLLVASSRFS